MKPVLIVDRDRSQVCTALELLDECRIPAVAVESLEEAVGLAEDESDRPAAMLVDLAVLGTVDGRTRRGLSALRSSRRLLVVGVAPDACGPDRSPLLDLCVSKPASAEEYWRLLSDWCCEPGDRRPGEQRP